MPKPFSVAPTLIALQSSLCRSKTSNLEKMAEEQPCPEGQRCPEGLRCANNCGFFGSSATLNLCSKCYGDHLKAQEALIAFEKSIIAGSSSSSETEFWSSSAFSDAAAAAPESAMEVAEGPMRCSACRKKVGLIGFRCRCGSTYCGAHRYAEQHACCFDFKSAGRDAIARCNPIIKAKKIDKI